MPKLRSEGEVKTPWKNNATQIKIATKAKKKADATKFTTPQRKSLRNSLQMKLQRERLNPKVVLHNLDLDVSQKSFEIQNFAANDVSNDAIIETMSSQLSDDTSISKSTSISEIGKSRKSRAAPPTKNDVFMLHDADNDKTGDNNNNSMSSNRLEISMNQLQNSPKSAQSTPRSHRMKTRSFPHKIDEPLQRGEGDEKEVYDSKTSKNYATLNDRGDDEESQQMEADSQSFGEEDDGKILEPDMQSRWRCSIQ